MRTLFAILALLLSTAALAQTCQDELTSDLSAEELAQSASFLQAARLLERAVTLLEPALPPSRSPALGLNPTLAYLDARALLPEMAEDAHDDDEVTLEQWRDMLSRFSGWYGVTLEPSGDLSAAGLSSDLGRLIALAAPRLQPLAVIATDPSGEVPFWGVLLSGSPRARLLVQRPPQERPGAPGDVAALLPHLSNCARQVRSYVYTNLETAKRLFMANNAATMYVAAVVPDDARGWRVVPAGQEEAYLGFEAEALEGLDAYAAFFDGPRLSPVTLFRLATQVRTNMNPAQLVQLLLAQ